METLSRRARDILDRARAEGALPRATKARVFHELERKLALGAQPHLELTRQSAPTSAPASFGSSASPMWIRLAVGAAAAAGAAMLLRPPTAPTRLAAPSEPPPIAAPSQLPAQPSDAVPTPVVPAPPAERQGQPERVRSALRMAPAPPLAIARTAAPTFPERNTISPRPTEALPATGDIIPPEPVLQAQAQPYQPDVSREENARALAAEALADVLEPPPATAAPAIVAAPPAARPIKKRVAKPSQPSALDEELELLAAAQAALRDGLPERALAQLAEHAWRFPQGQLAESRDVARILALCRAGKSELAHAESARFLRRHPASPFARRVTTICR